MKNFKTIIGLIMSMVMAFTMSLTSMAASVTVTNALEGHTYKAYQVFSGTQAEGSKVLGDIEWGSGVNNTEALLADLKADATIGSLFTDAETAADVAKALGNVDDYSVNAKAFAKVVEKYIVTDNGTDISEDTTSLDAGYYLIVDTTEGLDGKDDAYNLSLLQVTGDDVTIANKTDTPTVEKKVNDINDSTGVETGWQDSADYDIGDEVPFQLTATLGSTVSDYKTYKLVFHDTLSKGLTYVGISSVKVAGNEITSGYEVDSNVDETSGETTLTITFNDVIALGAGNGNTVVVEYTATLNEDAVIGSTGNPNDVYLEYSNNPNNGGEGDTGNTPEDTVIVFTYKVVVNKVDENKTALAGAGFTLYKLVENPDYDPAVDGSEEFIYKSIKEIKAGDATTFEFKGLDDGQYKLVETETPAGYNTIDPVEFTVTAEHDITSDSPALTSLSGNAASGKLEFTVDESAGSLTTDVVNKSGSTLPETGGMGTRVLYTLGGIFVLAALVLLVTKRRMSNN